MTEQIEKILAGIETDTELIDILERMDAAEMQLLAGSETDTELADIIKRMNDAEMQLLAGITGLPDIG